MCIRDSPLSASEEVFALSLMKSLFTSLRSY
jgi:hypothetical protein